MGSESHVIERFVGAGVARENIAFARETFTFNYPGTPVEFLALFRNYYGPTMKAYAAAETNGRAAELQRELAELFTRQNQSSDPSNTIVPATFLRVTITV